MQLTGPVFLLIFLPLSLPPALFFRRRRAVVLTLLSALWYVLAGLQNPLGILHIFLLAAAGVLLSRLPCRKRAAAIGIGVAVAGWLAARILAEYTNIGYMYPAGLTLVSLGVISLLADRAADRVRDAGVFECCSYLLFYPVLMLGPVLRFSDYLDLCDTAEPGLARLSQGIRVYIGGYIKRLAIAAPLLRALDEIFTYDVAQIPASMILLALLIAFFLAYFFLTGTTSIARGVALMYGMNLPCDDRPLFSSVLPTELPKNMFLSLDGYFDTYVRKPILRKLPGRAGRMLAALAVFLLSVFFFRLRPSMLLLALPFLLFALWQSYGKQPHPAPHNLFFRAATAFLSSLFCAVFVLGLILPEPMSLFDLFRAGVSGGSYEFYYIYGTLSGAHYLPITILASALFVPIYALCNFLQTRLTGKALLGIRITESVLLFAGFGFTLLYFMPQFPVYANRALAKLYI